MSIRVQGNRRYRILGPVRTGLGRLRPPKSARNIRMLDVQPHSRLSIKAGRSSRPMSIATNRREPALIQDSESYLYIATAAS